MPKQLMTASPGWPVLEVIGRVSVPEKALDHRFVKEVVSALADGAEDASLEAPVAGTLDSHVCELYGWGPNVSPHVDRTGYVYLACLNEGESLLHALHLGKASSVTLLRGDVVRLWDHAHHWTEDSNYRVAAFVGSFEAPKDTQALRMIADGIRALANGDYYGAPRASHGLVTVQEDECYAAVWESGTYEPMLLGDAKAHGRYIIGCARCGRPASSIDPHWPYFWDHNRCRNCDGSKCHSGPLRCEPCLGGGSTSEQRPATRPRR